MKWIKASERLPDKAGESNKVIIRKVNGLFVTYGFKTFADVPQLYFEYGGISYTTTHDTPNAHTFHVDWIEWIEWLDESEVTPPVQNGIVAETPEESLCLIIGMADQAIYGSLEKMKNQMYDILQTAKQGYTLCKAPPPPVQSSQQGSEYLWLKVFEITQQEVLKGESRRKLMDLLNSKFIISTKKSPVQSDSGVEEVLRNTGDFAGKDYVPVSVAISAMEKYAAIKTKALLEALEGMFLDQHIIIQFPNKEAQTKYNNAIRKAKSLL